MPDWRLSEAELHTYRQHGLVRPAARFAPDEVAAMRALLEDTLATTPGTRPESLVCPHIAGMSGVQADIAARWLEVATGKRLIDLAEQVIGPDIVLWGSQVFCKPARTGIAVPWHQDGHFWPIRPLATVSIWIAIDDVTVDNGAMRFISGSQRTRELLPHADTSDEDKALNAELLPEHIDLAKAEYDTLPAGGMSLHDVFLVHGSDPNHSAHRRAAFAIRYMPATSHYDRGHVRPGTQHLNTQLAARPIFLLRGHDWTGKTGMIDLRPAA